MLLRACSRLSGSERRWMSQLLATEHTYVHKYKDTHTLALRLNSGSDRYVSVAVVDVILASNFKKFTDESLSHRVRQYLYDIAVSMVDVARCGQRLRYVAVVDLSDLVRGSGHGILSDWQSVK